MTRERPSATIVGDTSVSPELIAEINNTPEIIGADVRGAAPVHTDMAAGAFVKSLVDPYVQQAQETMRNFEATASERDIEALYNPAQHLMRILELADGAPENAVSQSHRKIQTSRETGRLSSRNESIGRAALWGMRGMRGLKHAQHKAAVKGIETVSRLPKTYNAEQAQQKVDRRNAEFIQQDQNREHKIETLKEIVSRAAHHEGQRESSPRLTRLRSAVATIGLNAISKWKNLPTRQRDTVDSKGDNYFKRIGNRLKNIEVTKRGVTCGIGALALAGVAATGISGLAAAKDATNRQNMVYAGVTYAIEQHRGIDTTVIAVGGNKQWTPPQELVEKGLDQGVNVEGLDWISEMGPLAGTVDSRVSLNDGSSALENRFRELDAAGQNTGVVAYSWGTVATAQAYHDIKMSDPELYSRLQPPVLYGAPLGPNGAFNGPYGKVAMAVLGVNPDIIDSLPRGTTFVYNERDPYATSGNGQQPLTAAFNMAMMQYGSHGVQEGSDFVTIEDSDGNFHKIHRFDVAAALGVWGAGNEELNKAINALFPLNNDPDSKERPKADAIAAMFYGAQSIDRIIDPSGNFTLFEDIQAQLPDEWRKLMQHSVDGFNDATAAVMNAANNPTPENIDAAFQAVIATMRQVSGDLDAALARDMNNDFKNGAVTVAAQQIAKYTGLDYNTVHQQMSMFANNLEQTAKTIAADFARKVETDTAQAQVNHRNNVIASAVTNYAQNVVETSGVATATQQVAHQAPRGTVSQGISSNSSPTVLMPRATVREPASGSLPQTLPIETNPRITVSTRNAAAHPAESAPIATVSEPAAPAPVPIQEAAPAVSQPVIAEAPAAPARSAAIVDAPVAAAPVEVAAPAPVAPAPASIDVLAPVPDIPEAPAAPVPMAVVNEPAVPSPAPIDAEKATKDFLAGVAKIFGGNKSSSHKKAPSDGAGISSPSPDVLIADSSDPDAH